jgi:hypothetical protein
MILMRYMRKKVVIIQLQLALVHQTFLLFSIQSLQLHNSSLCNVGNLIWPEPMHSKLPKMLHEITVIYQYHITFLKYRLLDVSILVGLLSLFQDLLMKSCNNR